MSGEKIKPKSAEFAKGQAVTVREAAADFLARLQARGVSEAHFLSMQSTLGKFAEDFGKSPVADVSGEDIVRWINSRKIAPSTSREIAVKLSSFFGNCVKIKLLSAAPEIDRSALPQILEGGISALTMKQTRDLLRFIRDEHPQYLANYVLRLFCGLGRAEASRMRWEWIDEKNKRIVIPSEFRTASGDRVLEAPNLPETVFAWLAAVPAEQKHGTVEAPPPVFHERTIRMNFPNIPRNALRNTFCSMHISFHSSAMRTARLLHVRDKTALFRRFRLILVPPKTAQTFFALTPDKLG